MISKIYLCSQIKRQLLRQNTKCRTIKPVKKNSSLVHALSHQKGAFQKSANFPRPTNHAQALLRYINDCGSGTKSYHCGLTEVLLG